MLLLLSNFVRRIVTTMDDEKLSMLLAMGFPDIGEIKKALRLANNDINEAVTLLTNDQPLLTNEIDMQDITLSHARHESGGTDHNDSGFPTTNLYELEQRVFQVCRSSLGLKTFLIRYLL